MSYKSLNELRDGYFDIPMAAGMEISFPHKNRRYTKHHTSPRTVVCFYDDAGKLTCIADDRELSGFKRKYVLKNIDL